MITEQLPEKNNSEQPPFNDQLQKLIQTSLESVSVTSKWVKIIKSQSETIVRMGISFSNIQFDSFRGTPRTPNWPHPGTVGRLNVFNINFFPSALLPETPLSEINYTPLPRLRKLNTVKIVGGTVFHSILPCPVVPDHSLADAPFGSNHSFADMNIHFTPNEFRKQAEWLIWKCVVTGQEVPSTERSLREDLYKKHMTGEPFACRSSYTVLTR